MRAPGVCSAGSFVGGPLEEACGVAVADERAVGEHDHAVGRGEAALEAMLDQQHGRVGLLVQAPQLPDQLIARDGIELRGRLVEQHERRPRDERGRERDALQLTAGELGCGAIEQVRDAQRERGLLDRARDHGAAVAEVLERQRELGANGAHDHLRLGVLEQRARERAERGGGVLARVEPADADGSRRSSRRGSAARARQRHAAASTCPTPRDPPARRTRRAAISRLTSRSASRSAPG